MSDQQEEPGYGERDDADTSPQTGGGVDPDQVDADVATKDDAEDDDAS
jgi:hypothetical protein